jgi:hypothetical protein
MTISFDIISDLNLSPEDSFNWEGKATSLYCVVAGNISKDLRTIHQTLAHLSRFYQGVFYTIGSLEYDDASDINKRTDEIFKVCKNLQNVVMLHHHVVIIDGIAIVGANGWCGETTALDIKTEIAIENQRYEDLYYLKSTLERLQKHLDVKKIMIVSHSVPGVDLYFGEEPSIIDSQLSLDLILPSDTEKKVSHWVYGTYGKVVDTVINGINYLNNSYYKRKPYWAKRIEITI